MPNYIEEKIFEKENFSTNPFPKGEYEDCVFRNCDFSNADLSHVKFSECEFFNCNISMANLNQTAFKNVAFKDCKMLGLRFDYCSKFGLSFSFENCILNHSSFYGVKMKKTLFKVSALQEVDFTESDMTESRLENCDLDRSAFHSTILEKADLRTSFNYAIDPETNKIRKAKFSLPGALRLLHKYNIEIDY